MATDVIELFLRASQVHSERPAVIEDDSLVTYAQLRERVERLAQALRTINRSPRVAIVLPQGGWAYAAMFATLIAGGVYTPINLDHPPSRRLRVLRSFAPHAIVTTEKEGPDASPVDPACSVITVERLGDERFAGIDPAGDLAYVMFTSGSTGEPKGVMIPRTALAHYTEWAHRELCVVPEDRWSQHPNIAFDLSVLDIFGALCAGAALVSLRGRKYRLFPGLAIRDHQLTIWNSVPSVVDLMQRTRQLDRMHLQSLRLMTFCGEPLLKQHLDSIFGARPDIEVHNTYGPTEATVSMTLLRLRAANYERFCGSSVALGSPIQGMTVCLEGGDNADEGELIIVGPQVARGYWNDVELTRSFFADRTINGIAQPSYRTGDWVKRIGDNLYFVSRIDRQIKRQGNRIELGDIDAALRQAGATGVCTICVDGRIVGFIEQASGDKLVEINKAIRTLLPTYALPDELRTIAQLPRNANDKIDLKALESVLKRESMTVASNERD